MRYTVTWRWNTKQKLAEIWLAAADRRIIAGAADKIDALLAEEPESIGEEFYGDFLIAVPPLAVVYSVSAQDRIVQIVDIYHQRADG